MGLRVRIVASLGALLISGLVLTMVALHAWQRSRLECARLGDSTAGCVEVARFPLGVTRRRSVIVGNVGSETRRRSGRDGRHDIGVLILNPGQRDERRIGHVGGVHGEGAAAAAAQLASFLSAHEATLTLPLVEPDVTGAIVLLIMGVLVLLVFSACVVVLASFVRAERRHASREPRRRSARG